MTNFSGKHLNAGTGGPKGGGMDGRHNVNEIAEMSAQYLVDAAEGACFEFKQTELGLIPADWELVEIESLNVIGQPAIKAGPFGSSLTKDIYVNDGFKIYGQEQVISGDHQFGDYFVDELKFRQLRSCEVLPGDILLSLVGTAGKLLIIPENAAKGIINPRLLRFRLNQNKIIPLFFKNLFESERVQSYLAMSAQGGTMAVLNASILKRLSIPLPNIIEQTAIANALSDVDALISELEKLIAKKQAIKTATMQQLLTGRTRLPHALREDGTPKGTKLSELGEIPEDWEVKTYGEVFTFLSTSTNSRADLSEDGDFGYVHYGDIHTEWNNKLDLNKERLPRISKNIVSSAFVMDGDLIMADASEDYEGIGKTVEVFNVGDKQLVAGLHTFLLRDKEKVLADGFRGYLHSIPAVKSSFDRLATGMKVYGISKNNLSSVCIPVPSLEEQTAIATILSDMDAEIQALEQRLGKTRQIKQGMMQELLTGKTRLIKGEAHG
ncbi:TPA: restriction endonuclease subunit S [Vibrio vulnificus]